MTIEINERLDTCALRLIHAVSKALESRGDLRSVCGELPDLRNREVDYGPAYMLAARMDFILSESGISRAEIRAYMIEHATRLAGR